MAFLEITTEQQSCRFHIALLTNVNPLLIYELRQHDRGWSGAAGCRGCRCGVTPPCHRDDTRRDYGLSGPGGSTAV
jgi:hypothetical protein